MPALTNGQPGGRQAEGLPQMPQGGNMIGSLNYQNASPVLQKLNNSAKILDLGSGGGFPGIIIAILKPMCEIHLLEKSKKKCYFLNKTIDLLGLKNAKVLNTVISKNNSLGSYTLITARAFSSTTNILELTENNLDDDGKYVLLK